MKRYLMISGGMIGLFLLLFLLIEALGVPILRDPMPWLGREDIISAAIGFGLLVSDVVLPVPSSIVMVAHGALFGVVMGTLLSLAGSLGAALLGFTLGRRGGRMLESLLTNEERGRADHLLNRWGLQAVILTRPVPILAEAVSIMAGASSLGWGRMMVAALLGSLPPALLYSLVGAAAANFQGTTIVFLFLLSALLSIVAVRWAERVIAHRRNRLVHPERSSAD